MKVAYLMRRPRPNANYSVELLTRSIIDHLSPSIQASVHVSKYESTGLLPRLYNIIEAALHQGDVNHVTGDVTFLTYLLRRERTLLTILDCGVISGPLDLRKRLIRLLWFAVPIERSALVTVISHDVKRQLLGHVRCDPAKVHVVPVAVPAIYRRIPKAFNQERPTILQVGASENKNRTRLFTALRDVPCRLVLVGELSREHSELLARNDMEYESHVGVSNEEMLRLYAECDVVAFPSTFEGFGMPIIEGNIVGRPVVAGNVTSMPEVAGKAACLVDPFDVASIRQGFLRVIQDAKYREALVEEGVKNARRYTAESITQQYESLYERIAAGECR